jgi:hypothetical protein
MGNTNTNTNITLTGEEYRQMEEDIEIERYRDGIEIERYRDMEEDIEIERYHREMEDIHRNLTEVTEDEESRIFAKHVRIFVEDTEQECCVCLEPTRDRTYYCCKQHLCRECIDRCPNIEFIFREPMTGGDFADGIIRPWIEKPCPMCRQDLVYKLSLDCVPKDQRNNFNTEQEYYLVEHYPPPPQPLKPSTDKGENLWYYEFVVMHDLLKNIKKIE